KVLYDHQIFSMQPLGGISRYYVEMIDRYEKQADIEPVIAAGEVLTFDLRATATYRTQNPRPSAMKRKLFALSKDRAGVDLMYWSNMRRSLKAVKKGDFDVFQPTYYDPYFLDAIGSKPFYLEVHDMIHELYPELFPGSPVSAWKKRLVERAARIVTVSDSTRSDLVRLFGVEPGRVRTIHQGVSLRPELSRPQDAPSDLPERYVLFVGKRSGYKNFDRFAEVMSRLMSEDRGLHLVCAGGGPFSPAEAATLERLGIGTRSRQSAVSDSALCQLYARARAFVFPSLYEGFGLPVLEAFACGCPAVLACASSLPEIGGDAAVYFDPQDAGSMEEALGRTALDDRQRERMVALGRERVKQFSWDRTAEETQKVYREMAGSNLD
ncbi:MAG: glycosyltransferase family 4 protein, partial [Methanomassiliicoccus sp.]|nr:glycosyltransferase family 4 protein [Methanomassiliicoccus sp.]